MNHRLVATKTKISNEFFPEHTRIPKEPQKILNCQDNLEKKKREREKLLVPPGLISEYTPKWQ